jgi:hypothetical protein
MPSEPRLPKYPQNKTFPAFWPGMTRLGPMPEIDCLEVLETTHHLWVDLSARDLDITNADFNS